MPIRVMIVDDQELVRDAFRLLLESSGEIEVVAEASEGQGAVETLRSLDVDVVLMDIRMPGMDGVEATKRIVEDHPNGPPRVLMLTTFGSDEHVFKALRAGASGFLLKDAGSERLFDAIRVIARGDALLDPTVTRRLVAELVDRPQAGAIDTSLIAALSEREREVMTLVGQGLSNDDIASTLFISVSTAKKHVSNAMMKLDARDRAQLVVIAYQSGLVRV
jgi:DNA-binding NarL/FixJ family response regulator